MVEKVRTAVSLAAYVRGVSTSAVGDLTQSFGMRGISKSQVPRLCGEVDYRIKSFPTRPRLAPVFGSMPDI
jgi:transposase-like protein